MHTHPALDLRRVGLLDAILLWWEVVDMEYMSAANSAQLHDLANSPSFWSLRNYEGSVANWIDSRRRLIQRAPTCRNS